MERVKKNKLERPDPVFNIQFESDDPEEQKKEIEEIIRKRDEIFAELERTRPQREQRTREAHFMFREVKRFYKYLTRIVLNNIKSKEQLKDISFQEAMVFLASEMSINGQIITAEYLNKRNSKYFTFDKKEEKRYDFIGDTLVETKESTLKTNIYFKNSPTEEYITDFLDKHRDRIKLNYFIWARYWEQFMPGAYGTPDMYHINLLEREIIAVEFLPGNKPTDCSFIITFPEKFSRTFYFTLGSAIKLRKYLRIHYSMDKEALIVLLYNLISRKKLYTVQ